MASAVVGVAALAPVMVSASTTGDVHGPDLVAMVILGCALVLVPVLATVRHWLAARGARPTPAR
jgi:hypothetical protein